MTTVTTTDLSQLTGDYSLDTRTAASASTPHAMVTKVRGAFNGFEATSTLDAGSTRAKSSAAVTIRRPASTPATPIGTRTCAGQHDFSHGRVPTISFVSTSAEQNGARSTSHRARPHVGCVTKPVSIPFEFTGTGGDPWATPAWASRAPW